jgi:16S rRNA (guanine966-N2)-methyltransferase
VRIVGGRLGGRRLVAPHDAATRPTADRVREALFSILGPLDGERVLDLYAGTGALALEALSRGALSAVLVESRKQALDAMDANVAALGASSEVVIVRRPVERARQQLVGLGPFELVFCDPPYAAVESGQALRALEGLLDLLAPGGRLILEHGSASRAPALAGLEPPDSRRYGDTTLSFYDAPAGGADQAPAG